MHHTAASIILSLLLLLFLAGASSPLWVRKEQTQANLSRLFVWFVPTGCITFGGVIILTGISDYFNGRSESNWTVITAALASVLVCAGSNMLYEFSLKRRVEQIELKRLQQRHPSSPWKWNKKWQNNKIEYSDKGEMILSSLTTATILSVMALSYITRKEDILKSFHENQLDSLIILYLFVMGAACSARHTIKTVGRWREYYRSTLIMYTSPAIMGGLFEGEIRTASRHVPHGGFDLKLACMEMDISFRNSFHSITEKVLWETEKKVGIENIRMGTTGIVFPISFSIPSDGAETDSLSRDRRVYWVLSAHGAGYEHCFRASFKIPVFKSQDSQNMK